MQHLIRTIIIFSAIFVFNSTGNAGPWLTGPLLAPAGHTVPKGHTNFELYGIDVNANGYYTATGELVHTPLFRSFVMNPILTHGFTDWLDVQLTVPYTWNSTQGQRYNRLTDTSLALGIQLFEQKSAPNRVDVRLLVQETFPTGHYDELNPALLGTDSTGQGSYQTQIGLNLQHLIQVFGDHYLRSRLILSRIYSSQVQIHGLSSFGGTINTEGTITPGVENDIDLAFEFTLTQNWVAVMEGYISEGQASRFNGILNLANVGSPAGSIGYGTFHETALAPALEYNFNENIGLIGGVWFPTSGRSTAHYTTYILALNAFW